MMDSTKSIFIAALQDLLDVRISSRLPDDKPEEFVCISRVGGGSDSIGTRNPRFLVECYATDEDQAEVLAEKLYYAMAQYRDKKIRKIKPDNNITEYSDPDTDYYRLQFTASVTIRLYQEELNNITGE